MNLHELKPAKGSIKKSKRIGRGQGSTRGGTSTKGHKGDKSRAGHKTKFGNEGGQMPLYRRVPKFGFKNPFRVAYKAINLVQLQGLAEKGISIVDSNVLVDNGLASKNDLIKVLAKGDLTSKVELKVNAISASAKEAIEKAGGSVEII